MIPKNLSGRVVEAQRITSLCDELVETAASPFPSPLLVTVPTDCRLPRRRFLTTSGQYELSLLHSGVGVHRSNSAIAAGEKARIDR